MIKLGLYMLLGGFALLIGHGLYGFTRVIFTTGVPLILKLAFPAIGIGLLLIILMVIRERLGGSEREDFEEVDN